MAIRVEINSELSIQIHSDTIDSGIGHVAAFFLKPTCIYWSTVAGGLSDKISRCRLGKSLQRHNRNAVSAKLERRRWETEGSREPTPFE